jgi:septal ring factor EnvC (AmiA/AmiB activator)
VTRLGAALLGSTLLLLPVTGHGESTESVDVQLLKAEADLRAATTRIRELDGRLTTLDADRIAAEMGSEERRRRMSVRLRVMYRLRHRGFLPLLFSADSPHELLRSARYLWWIVRSDRDTLDAWRDELADATAEEARLDGERDQLLLAAGEAAARREVALAEREAAGGSRDWTPPRTLDDGDGGGRVVARYTQPTRERVWLSEEEREALPVHKRVIVQEAPPAPDVEIDLSSEPTPSLTVEELKPAAPFERSQGLLPMPARGALERSGRGLAVLAKSGDPIRAVHDGEVARILWIRGFGNVAILDHGDGWHTVYGHAAAFTVEAGQWVTSGTALGTVGDTGSLEGPRLHFEVRHDRVPQDPLDWLKVPAGIARPD